jgi:hypothetical protein
VLLGPDGAMEVEGTAFRLDDAEGDFEVLEEGRATAD